MQLWVGSLGTNGCLGYAGIREDTHVRPPGSALRCTDTHVYPIVFFVVALV